MNIIPVIRDLLLKNQKVVLPGFGSLVIDSIPAQLNKAVRIIAPPKMSIRFEKTIKDDDGSISGYLVRKLKMDTGKADQVIRDFTDKTRESLKQNGFVTWEGLGTLKGEPGSVTVFEPSAELLRRINLFELPSINIPQVEKKDETRKPGPEPVVHTPNPVREIPVIPPVIEPLKKRKWWVPVTILLVFVALLLPVYLSGNLDMLFSDFTGLFKKEKPAKEKLVFGNPVNAGNDSAVQDISKKLDEQVDRDKAFAYEEPAAEVKAQPAQPVESPAETVTDQNKPFHIISGAFLVPNNAERHKALLEKKGFTPAILPKKGDYYMVSLGSFSTFHEAAAAMKQMQGQVKNELWVLKR
ncbi:MAG TPA: SPOR domain-containing protein [Bacteroidales bacterium]|nr:SPOR domain-containing protein [Bacteroidales bacterium]